MSKIDYSDASNFIEVDKIIPAVLGLNDSELMQEWMAKGCVPLHSFSMTYSVDEARHTVSISNELDASIKRPFRMFIPHDGYLCWQNFSTDHTERWEKRIVVAALRAGVKPFTVSKYEELVGNNQLMSAIGANEVSPGLIVALETDWNLGLKRDSLNSKMAGVRRKEFTDRIRNDASLTAVRESVARRRAQIEQSLYDSRTKAAISGVTMHQITMSPTETLEIPVVQKEQVKQ